MDRNLNLTTLPNVICRSREGVYNSHLAGHSLAALLVRLVTAVVVAVALVLLGDEESGALLGSGHSALVILHG